jgi:hypothetical protein
MYLRDTHIIQGQHRKAPQASSEEVMDLISAIPADILRLSTMSKGTGDRGCTMMTWIKGCLASIHSFLIYTAVMEIAFRLFYK